MASKYQFITELYDHTLLQLTSSHERWTGFLRAACYNYKCPFDEQVLIYAQRPNATAVLELEKWNRQFGRWVNRGATGIAVLDDDHGKGRLKYYFDVADTHESQRSWPVPIWCMDPAFDDRVIETLESTFGNLAEKETLADAVLSASRNAVADNLPDYLRDLRDCRENSLLEELDDLNVEVSYRRALEASIAYMLMTRLSIPADAFMLPENFQPIYDFNTPATINALGIATSDIAEIGLREISRTVMQAQKEQFFANDGQIKYDTAEETKQDDHERGVEHGDHLQDAGGLPSPEPAAAPGAGDPPGQVRGAAASVPDEAPQSSLHQSEDQREAGRASGGDRGERQEDGESDRGADGPDRGPDGEPESLRSDALDGPDEQSEAYGGGTGDTGSDLRIIDEPDEAGSEDTELPAFLDVHLMEAILLDDKSRTAKRQDIFNYFQKEKDFSNRTEFIKNAYQDVWTEVLVDDVRVGYHKQDDGLLMWAGSYLTRTAESVFSWAVVTEITEGLIERGEYKIKLGLQNAPVMAEQMTLFGMGDQLPVYEIEEDQPSLFPPRQVPQEVIDKALYTAGNSFGSAYRVAAYYMWERTEPENITFLRREFGKENGRGIEHDGRKYAVWFQEDGIHLACGTSVHTGYDRTTVTWAQASQRVLELLEAGTYLSQAELEQAYDTALRDMANSLIDVARDLSQEAREDGLLRSAVEAYEKHRIFPDCVDALMEQAKDDSFLQQLSEEYEAFLDVYGIDRDIMRYRLSEYNVHRIKMVLGGVECPRRNFQAQPDFMRQCKMFITQDEIENYFLRGDAHEKLGVYSYFCCPHSKEENQKFIKSRFGEYSGCSYDGYDYTKTHKGLEIRRQYGRKDYDAVKLTIPNVVKLYENLIRQRRYPGEDAIAKIPEYTLKRVAQAVYSGFATTTSEVPCPYPADADYYKAIPIIQQQLADPTAVQEMLGTLTSVLDGTDPADRYYHSRQNAKEVLSRYASGSYDLFNHRHPTLPSPAMPEQEPAPVPEAQPKFNTETVAVYPAEENKLPYDIVIQTLKVEEPQHEAPQTAEEAYLQQHKLAPVPKKKERSDAATPLHGDGVNYRITDDQLGVGTPSQRYENNVAAIRLLREIESENRHATAEEQEVLAQYVGWGGLADCFDPKHSKYGELKSLMTDAEYASARESTLTAFYTPPVVIRSIYQVLERMGFSQGNILEPSCGTGNFLGMLPDSMASSKLYGVELDDLSGRIAKQLYQKSSISIRGYEKMDFPDNFFDVAIGNVPFGQLKLSDRRYDRLNLPIHEYFMAKTLDKVRPGGAIAFLTSSFTMDKRTATARKYIAQRAELLGAIRLPNDTFKGAAGTEVVSDILFFQKRDRMVDIEPEWVHLATDDNNIQQNSYFIDHPDMVLGEMKLVSGPFGPTPTCEPYPEQELGTLLANAIQNINGQITDYERTEELDGEDRSIEADPSVRNFSYTIVNDQIYYRENSRMNPVEVSKTAESRIRGLIELRDCVRTLLEYQTEDFPDEEIQAQQVKLNKLYDSFTKEYGLINSRGNAIAFDQDSSYFLLCSLEILDENKELERKADLFTKRTIRSRKPAEKVDTAVEALALSIGEKARVDMEYMEQLTDKSEEQLFSDLTGVVFLNPDYEKGVNDKYIPADEYLSGNVRKKLAYVQAFAAHDPRFQVNVDALTQVQPTDLTASEISVRLGATWLKPEYYRQFIFETLGTSYSARYSIKVHYSKITGEWRIEGKSKDRGNVKAYNTYGTKRVNAYEIIEDSLNLKDVRIFDYSYDEAGRRVAVLNKKETAIAQGKQELLKEAFAEWIWKDPDRRANICKAYNILFNSNRPREYDGSHINFSGMNPEISLRKHQVNAIAHILYGGNTLLAHVVGAGKTFEMVAAAMESKRLGLCQKSLFVVPNHLTEQWATEFLQLYPAANILVATKKDFETKNRKKFCGRIATGDYDAIIIGHSQFEKIPMSVERQRAILEQQVDEVMMSIREAKESNAENFTIKQMEKTRKNLEYKIEKLNDQSRKDDVVTFEELGVDRLFIDEAHYYKNLFLYTKMRNVGGIAQTEAQKSSDLFMKCRYLDEITGGRGIIFATGTPISNSMVELYTLQRYLQMSALQEQEMQHFDSWAANYGETVTAIELSPEGTGYRAKTRFAKFYNLPELMSLFKNVADIQTADMLKLPVPEAHYHNVALKPSEYQKDMVASLAKRAEQVRNREVDSSVDNMLLITNDGRKLALDQRLVNPMLPDDPNSKAAKCAENVFEIWQRTAPERSTQMIFCDLSTPKDNGEFSVYNDIRDKLLALGIPEEEIAFIHNAKSESQKKDLFGKVRSGQIRVLLGSTQKMGAGTNVQRRLIALHHLDCPWRPSDLQQREGRIIRQGNENPEVDIYSYVTEGTFDAYLYQLVESKQKFISQIMTSKSPVRSAEDVDEQALSYAEIKALASGNPMIKEKMDLDIEVSRLKLLKASHLSQKYSLEDAIAKTFPKDIAETTARLAGYGADIATVKDNTHPNPDGFSPMTLAGTDYAEKKEAGGALLALCQNMLTPEPTLVGSYRGLPLELSFESFSQEYRLTMIGKLRHTVTLGTDVFGNIQRMDNQLETLPVKEQTCRERLSDLQTQLETAKAEVNKPFVREEELKTKAARLEELNALLNMDNKEEPKPEPVVPQKPRNKEWER